MRKKYALYIFILISVQVFGQDPVRSDSVPIPKVASDNDSLLVKPNEIVSDTTSVPKEKSPILEAEITYTAVDSIITDLVNQKVFMYKGGVVQYQEIELKADYIELDLNTKQVYAEGLPDSTGTKVGTPVFRDGQDEFESKTLRYSFETQKGYITDVKTKQGDGTVHSERTKKISQDAFILEKGKYSTCDAEHPHFYLRMTKAKVISGKKIITGPAYLVLEDLPLYPLMLPFGFFPSTTTYSSGILMPTYGEEQNRGFFLRDGGYYWAAGQYFDLALRGSVYSKGSWGVDVGTNYRKRYKFSGNFNFKYNSNKYSEDSSPSKGFSLMWSHSQDSKSNPNRTFSASVNLSTSSYDKQNSLTAQNYLQTTKSSSISYTRKFENTPFNLSMNLRHSQNSMDTTLTLSLPEITFNVSKINPFKKKDRVGQIKWYEKIGFSYTANIRNSITAKENEIFQKSLLTDWSNGWQHNIPISLPSFNLFKFINVSPSFSYSERWYTSYLDGEYIYDKEKQQGYLLKDTIYAFKRNYDYSYSINASTNLYGMYKMKNPKSRIDAVRHKITPSVSFSYRPDFGKEKYGFYGRYTDEKGTEQMYNRFEGAIFGSAGYGRSGSVSFDLNNNFEAKVLDISDTTRTETSKEKLYKKVKLLDLNMNTSYNLVADSMNMSMISIRGRTTIKDIGINFGGNLDPYNIDRNGNRYHEYMWNVGKGLNKIGRLTGANLSFGYQFQSKKEKNDAGNTKQTGETGEILPDGINQYVKFNIPWSFNFDYSLNYNAGRKPSEKGQFMQSLNFSGNMSLTENWRLTMNTNFDIQAMKFSFTTFSINRTLHCWSMSFNFVPFGDRKSYSFTLNASSSLLKDLKVEKQRSWMDNN